MLIKSELIYFKNKYKVAVGLYSGTLKIYDPSKTLINTIYAHTNAIIRIKVLANNQLSSCSADKTVKIWNMTDWSLIQTYTGHIEEVTALAQINENTMATGSGLYGTSSGGYFNIWTIGTTGTTIRTVSSTTGSIRALELLQNGLLASGDNYGYLKFWNYSTGSLVKSIKTNTNKYQINDIAVIDSQYLATGGDDKLVNIWDYTTYTLKKAMSGHTNSIRSLKVLSSQYLISGSYDFSTRVWNLNTYSQARKLTSADLSSYIYAVDMFNSSIVVTGDSDSKLKYFNISDGTQMTKINVGDEIHALASF